MFTIVAFTGGGIRGLMSATILQRLYAHNPGILHRTDLFAGCSTGSVIVSELAAGKSPEEVIALFTGPEIGFYDKQNPAAAAVLHPRELDQPGRHRPAAGQGRRRRHRAGEGHARALLALRVAPRRLKRRERMSTSNAAPAGTAGKRSPPDGPYAIRSLFDRCVMAAADADGAPVTTAEAAGAIQAWRFIYVEPGWWMLAPATDPGLVMTLDADLPPKPPVVLAPPGIDRGARQLWQLVPA